MIFHVKLPCENEYIYPNLAISHAGTSHADTWRKGLIHGPQAPFTVPYDDRCTDGDGGGEDGAMDTGEVRDNALAIPLAAARTAATAVATTATVAVVAAATTTTTATPR